MKVVNILVLRGSGSGLAVLLTLLVARYLEATAAAAFLLLFNVTTVAALCFRWGLDDLIVRRMAAEASAKAAGVSSYLMRLAHRRVALWMFFAAAATVACGLARLQIVNDIGVPELLTAVAISGLIALTASAGRVHQGRGRTNFAALIINILVLGLLVLGLLMLVGIGIALSSWRLQLVYFGISALVYLGIVWGVSLTRPVQFRKTDECAAESARAKVDRKAANRLGGVLLSQQALNWSALLIVPVAYGDRLFTSFMVTYKVALLITLGTSAVIFSFASRLAALFAAAEFDELRRLAKLMMITVAAASGLAAGLVFLGRNFVYTFADVTGLYGVLALLVGSQVFFALSSVYAVILSMCHGEAFLLKAQTSIVGAGVVFFTVLSFTAPLEVSCAAFAVTYLVQLLVLRQGALRILLTSSRR